MVPGSKYGVKMSYVTAKADYGTAGSVKNASNHLKEQTLPLFLNLATNRQTHIPIKYQV